MSYESCYFDMYVSFDIGYSDIFYISDFNFINSFLSIIFKISDAVKIFMKKEKSSVK